MGNGFIPFEIVIKTVEEMVQLEALLTDIMGEHYNPLAKELDVVISQHKNNCCKA